MNKKVLDHYLEFGMFTYPGLYYDYFKSLPDDVREIGHLLRWSFVHRTTLVAGNTGTNKEMKFGDMTRMPWYRQAEDDNLVTATAMIAELFRRDSKGLTLERKVEDKVVLTCRHIAILMASILKAKGIPARVRSGFAGYWPWAKVSSDHWINEYWGKKENRWIIVDVDGSFHNLGFDMYDIPNGKFDYSSDAWLNVRQGKVDRKHFWNADRTNGLIAIAWELFYDFHCLMNNEIIYSHHPKMAMWKEFKKLSKAQLKEIDRLAMLMQKPDSNFDNLLDIWNTKKEYRLLKGGLL
jgi:hypothetical protein